MGCWHPGVATTWQIQLTGATINQSINANLFDVDMVYTPAAIVASLHARGRKVLCYIDAGTWEAWRPDAARFPHALLGNGNGWAGERWLDLRQLSTVGPIMTARMDQCKAKGFDGIDFDNEDGYLGDTGFHITAADQLRYNIFLANAAHNRGLIAALKNDSSQVPILVRYYDLVIAEECHKYAVCAAYVPFVAAGKPVMEIEYRFPPSAFCPDALALRFNALKKERTLSAYQLDCRSTRH